MRKRTDSRTISKEMKHAQVHENREDEPSRRIFTTSLNQAAGKSKPGKTLSGEHKGSEQCDNEQVKRRHSAGLGWAGETPIFQDIIRVQFETKFDWQCLANPCRGERCYPVLWN